MLRRLAPRAIRVHERHRDKEPGLASFDTSLAVNAPAYITVYDDVRRYAKRRMEERTEAKAETTNLVYKIRIWGPQVARDIEHVQAGEFGENPDVPDDVIGDGKSLVEHATKRAEEGKEPLPYHDQLMEDLGGALAKAEAEWKEAEEAQADFRALRIKVREIGAALEKDLVAFRRVLRTVLGSEHPDYQKLRLERARTVDADDDPGAPPVPEKDFDDEDDLPPTPPINTQPTNEAPAAP
jgi:hypothetical protein